MTDLFQVLVLSLLPAAGNFGGALLAEVLRTSRQTLSLALHLAAGIVFGVIAVELAPRVFEGARPWLAALAFFSGAIAYVLLDAAVAKLTARVGPSSDTDTVRPGSGSAGAWMIYAAVSVDLFSDGLLIGVGSSLSFELALVLAVGQVTADIPEGFAAIANFKDKGVPRARRLLLAASFTLPIVAAALLSYFILRGQAEEIQLAVLAFAAGILLVAATEEIIGEAHEAAGDTKASALAIAFGFCLFALVASYFEA